MRSLYPSNTVQDGVAGFAFKGESINETINKMVTAFDRCLSVFNEDKTTWNKMRKKAKAAHFSGEDLVNYYYAKLYTY